MRITEITGAAAKRLRGSVGAAVSLWMVQMLCYLVFLLAGYSVTLLFNTVLYSLTPGSAMVTSAMGTLASLILVLAITFPLRLNIRRWFFLLDDGFLPLKAAFSYFTSAREYVSAFCYSLVSFGAAVGAFFLPMLPTLFLIALLRVQYLRAGGEVGSYFAVLCILTALLGLLALLFSMYFIIGFFFADYLYAAKIEKGPIAAIRRSLQLMRGRRCEWLGLMCMQLPYFLAALLIIPLPFCIANIRSSLALYARSVFTKEFGEFSPAGREPFPQGEAAGQAE